MVKRLDPEQIASATVGRQAWVRVKCISEANLLVMISGIADWKAAETTMVFAKDCDSQLVKVKLAIYTMNKELHNGIASDGRVALVSPDLRLQA